MRAPLTLWCIQVIGSSDFMERTLLTEGRDLQDFKKLLIHCRAPKGGSYLSKNISPFTEGWLHLFSPEGKRRDSEMISYQKVRETKGDEKALFLVNCDVDRDCQASAECLETACAVETMKLYSRSPFFIAKKCLIPRARSLPLRLLLSHSLVV